MQLPKGAILYKRTSGIYFLVAHSEVLYVGQTNSLDLRLVAHRRIPYETVYFLPCDPVELDSLERKYILQYQPIYNGTLKTKPFSGPNGKPRLLRIRDLGKYA